eukprot:1095576-Prymnesium_polylepis.1
MYVPRARVEEDCLELAAAVDEEAAVGGDDLVAPLVHAALLSEVGRLHVLAPREVDLPAVRDQEAQHAHLSAKLGRRRREPSVEHLLVELGAH